MTSILDRIQAAIQAGNLPAEPGGVTHVHAHHQPGCNGHRGEPCQCTPRITATVDGQALVIGENGEIIQRSKLQ